MFGNRVVVVFAFLQMVSFATAQDAIFVSCWTGNNSEVYRGTKVKSAVVSSSSGHRAYVTVVARANGGACSNVTQLYVAERAGEFRKVFEAQPTKRDDGNGMRLIGWDRQGIRLLAELGRFTYGTDDGISKELIVYSAKLNKLSHVDVEDALAKYFSQDCAFEFETKAWHGPGAAVVEVREFKDVLGETSKSCVQQPTQLVVDLANGHVSPMPSR
jgi:hypothetical protein